MEKYFELYQINIFKDVILPNLSIDKWLAIITLIIFVRTFIKSNRIAALNFDTQLAMSHRDIWTKISECSELIKITHQFNGSITIDNITAKQRRYVNLIIINTHLAYKAHKLKIRKYPIESQIDSGHFFNKEIPNLIWNDIKKYYEDDFIKFIDNSITLSLNSTTKEKSSKTFLSLLFKSQKWILKKIRTSNYKFQHLNFLTKRKKIRVSLSREQTLRLKNNSIDPQSLINDYIEKYCSDIKQKENNNSH